MKQREIFLQGEGDAWIARNAAALARRRLPEEDPLLVELLELREQLPSAAHLLEIGCGDGTRLAWLREQLQLDCHGIDPSVRAVQAAQARGVAAAVGTAEALPHADASFDAVLFGFCLYLCDRDDLFRIAAEADRVLKAPGWLLITDFYSPAPTATDYHHRPGVRSHKMDYRTLFTWHPDYTCYAHRVTHHGRESYTDDAHEWVATSVLRKRGPG